MGRPRKFINTSIYPDNAIEVLTRILYQDMVKEISVENIEMLSQPIINSEENHNTETQKINPYI